MKQTIFSIITALLGVVGLCSFSAAAAEWKTSSDEDEMTGKASFYAISPRVAPTKPVGFPYADLEAWLGYGCEGDAQWLYAGFNNLPPLADKKIKDGHNTFSTRIRWDEEDPVNADFTQDWGVDSVHFTGSGESKAIRAIQEHSRFLLEMDFHKFGRKVFRFDLAGASKAIKSQKAKCLTQLANSFANGADVNAKDSSGKTALHRAVAAGDKETAKMLLANGADINAKSKYGNTLLHLAAIYNHKHIAELLLANGADINEKDKWGGTALHAATKNNAAEIAALLLANGADINAKDKYGNTLLHNAVERNAAESAKVLLANDVDVNAKNQFGWTALHMAKTHSAPEIAQILRNYKPGQFSHLRVKKAE